MDLQDDRGRLVECGQGDRVPLAPFRASPLHGASVSAVWEQAVVGRCPSTVAAARSPWAPSWCPILGGPIRCPTLELVAPGPSLPLCPFPLGVEGWPRPSLCQPMPSASGCPRASDSPWRSQILPVSAPSLINVKHDIGNKACILQRPPQPHTSHCPGPIQMARKQPMQHIKEMRQK